jgi:hypothetical protein
MSTRIRSDYLVAAVLLMVLLAAPLAHAADKLKGFYSGSGGLSEDVHRVVLVQFAEDGTLILQQSWVNKDPQTWHAHWVQKDKVVTVTFDAVKDQPTPQPLVMNMNRGTLVPTSWDLTALGVLGPPQLTPFGGKNVKTHSVASCQAINTANPTMDCVTWSSGRR